MAKQKEKEQLGSSYLTVHKLKTKEGKIFEVGEDVSELGEERIAGLIKRGIVEAVGTADAKGDE
ncbi:hypothetical protein D9M68_712850 [compost metagenome]